MENTVLKKRLSTFRTEGGTLTGVSDDLLLDVLKAWETWTGTSKDFHEGLGLSKTQLGGLIKKAKKLNRSGDYPSGDFKEIKLEGSPLCQPSTILNSIELSWDGGKTIRFSQVEQLVDFLKKVA